MIEIREFQKSDVKDVSKITLKCISQINCKEMTKKELEFVKVQYSENGIQKLADELEMYVCTHGKKIIGSIARSENKIHNFFIDPKFHKQGIGSIMLRYIESKLKDKYKKILLDSSPYAVNFYKKFGYKVNKITYLKCGKSYLMFKFI